MFDASEYSTASCLSLFLTEWRALLEKGLHSKESLSQGPCFGGQLWPFLWLCPTTREEERGQRTKWTHALGAHNTLAFCPALATWISVVPSLDGSGFLSSDPHVRIT